MALMKGSVFYDVTVCMYLLLTYCLCGQRGASVLPYLLIWFTSEDPIPPTYDQWISVVMYHLN